MNHPTRQLHASRFKKMTPSERKGRRESMERRDAIWKSIGAHTGTSEGDNEMMTKRTSTKPTHQSSSHDSTSSHHMDKVYPTRHYARRGAGTRYRMHEEELILQPSRPACVDNTDYGTTNYEEDESQEDERKNYFRRGSVTKYCIDAPYQRLQPTKIAESISNKPRRSLPKAPSNSSLVSNVSEIVRSVAATKKKVSFGTVKLNEFPIILGDNPSVTSGAPVCIDWKCNYQVELKLSLYEHVYQRRSRQKGRDNMLIPVQRRALVLLRSGYTLDDIAEATLQAERIKKRRMETIERQGWDRFRRFMSSTSRALRGVLDPKPSVVSAMTA